MSNLQDAGEIEDFVGESHEMDLSPIREKTFLVAVSTGDRNKGKFLSTTVHGPYTFPEMVEEVGFMWEEYQHHAKVVVCSKSRDSKTVVLDENTIDYIEARYQDIIMDELLSGGFDKEFTCRASIVEDTGEGDPREEARKTKVEQYKASKISLPTTSTLKEEDDL